VAAVLEDDAIDAGAQLGHEVGLVAVHELLGIP
jgi:hypothetical protein